MLEPRPWPYSSEVEWSAWREFLDRAEPLGLPNIDALKVECQRELARIARCTSAEPVRPKPRLVPTIERNESGTVLVERVPALRHFA